MDALCRAKAKSKGNLRWRALGGRVRATAAQAEQTPGQECGGFRVPLCRRHARRVVQVGRRQGCSAGISNQRAVSQSVSATVSQRNAMAWDAGDQEHFCWRRLTDRVPERPSGLSDL